MSLRFLFLFFLIQIFSCVSETKEHNKKSNANEIQQKAFLLKDGVPVVFDSIPADQIKSSIKLEKEARLNPAKLNACVDFYCTNTFGKSKIHRQSNNGRYFIEYDPITNVNSLYSTSKPKISIGTIKLEANNPEFSIETIPLEDEPGILLTDGIYGFTKYGLKGNKLEKEFQIKFDTQWQHEKFAVISGQNKLLVFKRNLKSQTTVVDFYGLDKGELIDSKTINNKYKRIKYLASQKLLIFHHFDGLMIKDELCQNTLCEFSHKVINESITASQSSQQIDGLIRTKNGFTRYNYSNRQLDTIKYTLQPNTYPHQFFNTKKYTGVLYFEKDIANIDHQISKQGLIVFSKETNKVAHIPLTTNGFASLSFELDDTIVIKIKEFFYSVLFDNLYPHK